jgi:hypothetical protein
MAVIKELRGVCNEELTSEADFEHRWGKSSRFLTAASRRFGMTRIFKLRFYVQIDSLDRQIPMRVQNFEAALLFSKIRLLIGPELFL